MRFLRQRILRGPEVQLAIKLGSDADASLVSLSGETQMQVTMKWKLQNSQDTAGS
ncbi:MAG: hypothetical protein ACRESZ_00930 [Methylococcales bacterium]